MLQRTCCRSFQDVDKPCNKRSPGRGCPAREGEHRNPMGAKGIGEIGIVGAAAAVTNAVRHATGIRVRDLPITLEKLTS